MITTDGITIVLMHAILLGFLARTLIGSLSAKRKERRGTAKLTVHRGEHSMNFLFLSYGVTTVVFSLAIEVADFAVGHKATLIALDYIVLTYLFIFDSWFRNAVVFNILMTIEKD